MIKERILYSETLGEKVQLLTDGRTCWVNTENGECIGRWGRLGIDVHHTVEQQRIHGKQCLECVQGGSWERFCDAMHGHYGVNIPSDWISRRDDDEGT